MEGIRRFFDGYLHTGKQSNPMGSKHLIEGSQSIDGIVIRQGRKANTGCGQFRRHLLRTERTVADSSNDNES